MNSFIGETGISSGLLSALLTAKEYGFIFLFSCVGIFVIILTITILRMIFYGKKKKQFDAQSSSEMTADAAFAAIQEQPIQPMAGEETLEQLIRAADKLDIEVKELLARLEGLNRNNPHYSDIRSGLESKIAQASADFERATAAACAKVDETSIALSAVSAIEDKIYSELMHESKLAMLRDVRDGAEFGLFEAQTKLAGLQKDLPKKGGSNPVVLAAEREVSEAAEAFDKIRAEYEQLKNAVPEVVSKRASGPVTKACSGGGKVENDDDGYESAQLVDDGAFEQSAHDRRKEDVRRKFYARKEEIGELRQEYKYIRSRKQARILYNKFCAIESSFDEDEKRLSALKRMIEKCKQDAVYYGELAETKYRGR